MVELKLPKISKKIKLRKFKKQPQVVVTIKEAEAHSILNEDNKFFKGELNKDTRRFFFK